MQSPEQPMLPAVTPGTWHPDLSSAVTEPMSEIHSTGRKEHTKATYEIRIGINSPSTCHHEKIKRVLTCWLATAAADFVRSLTAALTCAAEVLLFYHYCTFHNHCNSDISTLYKQQF